MKKPISNNQYIIPVLTAVSAFLLFIAGNTADIILYSGAILSLNVATLIFAFTFFWKDFIQKKMGRNFAIINNLVASLLVFIISIEIGIVTGGTGFIWAGLLVVSLMTTIISETIDSLVYAKIKGEVKPALISNAVSVPIDTAIFAFFGFYLILDMPISLVLSLAFAQLLVKYTISGILSPLLKFVKREKVL